MPTSGPERVLKPTILRPGKVEEFYWWSIDAEPTRIRAIILDVRCTKFANEGKWRWMLHTFTLQRYGDGGIEEVKDYRTYPLDKVQPVHSRFEGRNEDTA